MGACPMGSAPFGVGSPAVSSSTPARPLVQFDGTPGDCARIDTRSGDWVLDHAGNKVGWDSVSQQVYLALRTELGSAAVQTTGVVWPRGTITGDLAARNRNAATAALKRLIDRQLIELIDVITARLGTSGARLEVRWRRLSTGQIESTFI